MVAAGKTGGERNKPRPYSPEAHSQELMEQIGRKLIFPGSQRIKMGSLK